MKLIWRVGLVLFIMACDYPVNNITGVLESGLLPDQTTDNQAVKIATPAVLENDQALSGVASESAIRERREIKSWSQLPSRSKRGGVDDASRDILMTVAEDYDVSAGVLYGIWSMESGRLTSNWARQWWPAWQLSKYGSACARRYKITKCRDRWSALQRICEQEIDGQKICEAKQVRSSYAIALGPMQHLSTEWSPEENIWGAHVVDYNQDGVFNPHCFQDATASAAKLLRRHFEEAQARGMTEENSWVRAVNLYLGVIEIRSSHYSRGVFRYSRNWCSVAGYCKTKRY